jgi:hypothetical protein
MLNTCDATLAAFCSCSPLRNLACVKFQLTPVRILHQTLCAWMLPFVLEG